VLTFVVKRDRRRNLLEQLRMDDQAHTDNDLDSAAGSRRSGGGVEQRLGDAEAAIEALRGTTSALEREIAVLRADFERLRRETEKAAGSKLP
jgi:hypothetical protein